MRRIPPARRQLLLLLGTLLVTARAQAETVVVGPSDGTCPGAVFSHLQSALDAAVPGSLVFVCAGVYAEQLLVTKRVTLQAAPGAILRPSRLDVLATSLRSGRPVAAAVTLRAPATIEGLAIDSSAHGLTVCDGSEPLLAGIFARGVTATIEGTSVTGVRFAPSPTGCANGVGILVQGNGGGGQRARIEGNTVTTYQRAGISIQDSGVRARVVENLVMGDGASAAGPQTGIEVTTGAAATVDDNVVRANAGPTGGSCALGTGIALAAPRLRARGNQLLSNTIGMLVEGQGHQLADDDVDGGSLGVTGILVDADELSLRDSTVRSVAGAGLMITGNRNRVRGNVVAAVHDDTRCQLLRADPACAAMAARCGVGLWLEGRANRITATTIVDVDLNVADDGRGNVIH
jgi:hypothetical protein